MSFALQCLNHNKQQFARVIRKHINEEKLKYVEAAEIFKISLRPISYIMNHREEELSLDLLVKAVVSAGMTVSMKITHNL